MRTSLDRLAPARRRLVLALVGTLLLALVAGGVALLLTHTGADPVADQSVPGPVIVVPGYGGTARDLGPVIEQLRREGRDVVAFEPSQGGTGDLRVQARRLADLARRTMQRTGAGSVDVVGYSAGGIVARLFVRDYGGASVVRRVLTLGSPHHGTDVAALAEDVAGRCPTACEQLATDSELIRRLNAHDETPSGPVWVTLRTEDDQTVVPVESAVLSGALNIDVQDLCPADHVSHDGLPGDPVVLATLGSALGRERPRAPRISC